MTHSNQAEQRVSAAMGYLDRETRKRANLTISTNTQVRELLFEGTQCVGVKAVVDGREQEFRGREVILSSGAIHSPAHLLRAGIGPVGHLKDMGIPVLMGLAGVGQRLMDHPSISLSSFVRRGARMNEHTRRHMQVGLRYSSGLPGVPKGDMFVVVLSKSAWHAVGAQIGSALTFVNKTYSETGQVKLASRDPARRTDRRVQPVVRPARPRSPDERFPQDGGDANERRRQGGHRQAVPGLLYRPRAQDRRGQQQEQDPHHDRRHLDGRAGGAAPLHDRQFRGRRFFVRRRDQRRRGAGDLRAQGDHRRVARLLLVPDGPADDPMAVVDTEGRVKGVQGLRVVDASIFPVVPCANTNFPVLMSAEKIAAAMQ